jgi:Fe-S cluster assembly protein SufD
MIAAKERHHIYLSLFQQQEPALAAASPSWMGPIRKAAIHRFAELGFPTTKNEEWKYTNVSPIARIPFQPATGGATGRVDVSLLPLPNDPARELDSIRLVFVNGSYSRELSATGALQAGVKLGSLARALADHDASLETHLARYAGYDDHAFAALNTAFMQDGAFIEIGKDVILDRPICLLYVSIADSLPTVTHPRNLVLAGRGSQVNIIEAYVGLGPGNSKLETGNWKLETGNSKFETRNSKLETGSSPQASGSESPFSSFQFPVSSFQTDGVYFTNSVTEVVVGEGALVDYCKVQQEGPRAFHVASLTFQQERSTSVTTHAIALGGALDREDLTTVLRGEGAESLLHGLYVISGEQHVDNHTVIDHAQPHCSSRELYKGILDGGSSGVFNGKIIVRKYAQKTDSKQSNKNLLLSENAVINTKPQLEIYADDVKCTHGATIGQIDQEAVFYLRSRGIALEQARAMLTQAFANDVIEKVKFGSLRERLREMLAARLDQGQKLGAESLKSERRASMLQEA